MLQQLTTRVNTAPASSDYSEGFRDYLTGKQLHRQGFPLFTCTNRDQRNGWRDEDNQGALDYLRALEDEGLPAAWAEPIIEKSAAYYDALAATLPF